MSRLADFSHQVAVVTGGGSGIGAACARLLAARGARVVVADVDLAGAERVANSIGGIAMTVDIGSEESINALAERCDAEVGAVGVLIANAGIIQKPGAPEDMTTMAWDQIVRVDQRGTYLSCIAFGRRMVRHGRGSIVALASFAGMRSTPLHAYAPAKAAVISMVGCLSAEWGHSGVRVNAVSPGLTMTPVVLAAVERNERDVSKFEANSALGRSVSAEEVAMAVVFLASAEASAITGVNLPVDAGLLTGLSWAPYGGPRAAS